MYFKTNQQNKITKDTLILLMCLFYPAINNYIWRVAVEFTGIIGLNFSIQVLDAIIWTLVIGYSLMAAHKSTVKAKTLLIMLLFALVSLLSFAFTAYDYFSASVLFDLLIGTLSFFIFGSFINIKNISHKQLYIAAVATLIISMFYSLYSIGSKEISLEDNMEFAYKVLPSVLVILSRLFTDQKKKLAIVFSLVGTIFLLLQGTRGPLLCLAIFVCLMLYKKYGPGKLFFSIGIIVLISAVILSSQFVKLKLVELSNKIDSSGYSSRFITMMIEGDLSDNNGRDAIKDTLLENIKENPFAIRGMFADRQATRGLIDREYNTSYENGTYAHSFWIEMIYDWGVFLGGVILLIVFLTVWNFIRRSDKADAYICMLFVCTGFVHLFLSGSYLQSAEFFFLIGLALNYRRANAKTVCKDVAA